MIPRRLLALATLAAVTTAMLLFPAGASARAPVYIQVVEKEFTLTLSRLKIPAGSTIFQVLNFGMDNHDLIFKRNTKGSKAIVFKVIGPNARATKTLQLPAGRYTLWCSVPGHRARGMVASLKVG